MLKALADRVRRQTVALDGKVVVITGAAGGIGRALAGALAVAGARLALFDRDAEGLEGLSATLEAGGAACLVEAFDITDEEAAREAVARVVARWGGVDILINNAGITHRSPLAETEPAVIRKVMEVNLFGAVYCTKAALESLVSRGGSIVAISSVAGFAPLVGRTGYCASKHALHGFFDTLRAELVERDVHVMVVCPSFIDTPIEENALGGSGGGARDGGRVVVGQLSAPEELAATIVEGLRQRRDLLLPSRLSRSSWWISRLAPALYERLMRRSQRSG